MKGIFLICVVFLIIWSLLIFTKKIKMKDKFVFSIIACALIWMLSLAVSLLILVLPIKNPVIVKQDTVYLEPFPNQSSFMLKADSVYYYNELKKVNDSLIKINSGVLVTDAKIKLDTTNLHLPYLVTYIVKSTDSTFQKFWLLDVKIRVYDTLFINEILLKRI